MQIVYKFKNRLRAIQKESLSYRLNMYGNVISDFSLNDEELSCSLNDNKIKKNTKDEILNIIKFYDCDIRIDRQVIFSYNSNNIDLKCNTVYQTLLDENIIYKEQEGVFLYFGIFQKLYGFLNFYFKKLLLKLGAEEVYLPSLISIETIQKSDYEIKNNSFCNYVITFEDMLNQSVLNPAACLPLYKCISHLKRNNMLFTGFARIFRNESGNYNELSRLREYGVRELVYISTKKQVDEYFLEFLAIAKEILCELDISGEIETATDMFFDEKFKDLATYQLLNHTKYEIKLPLTKNLKIACASINNHGNYFSRHFDFGNGGKLESSMCVGFGIERWCFAILCQFGTNIDRWPRNLKKLFNNYLSEG